MLGLQFYAGQCACVALYSLSLISDQSTLLCNVTYLCTQFCDDVVMGMFPVSQEKLLKLAALRLQYLDGDHSAGATMYVQCIHYLSLYVCSWSPLLL